MEAEQDADDGGLIARYIEQHKGWSRFRTALFDASERWQWWSLVLVTHRLPPSTIPFPRIDFEGHLSDTAEPMQMLKRCLRDSHHNGRSFEEFLDWLLHAFGDPDTRELPKQITEGQRHHWEQTFDLGLMLRLEGDWLGHYFETQVVSNATKNHTGFFSTPPGVCKMMVEMAMHDIGNNLLASVNEPCCGTGRILLEASNYSVNLSGCDINGTLVKVARVNGWLYMPSIVMPCPELLATHQIAKSPRLRVRDELREPLVAESAAVSMPFPQQLLETDTSTTPKPMPPSQSKGPDQWTATLLFPEP